MRALIYCRVSTNEQASANHYSIPNQKKLARDLVKRRGWTVLDVYEDTVSGKDDQRPDYQKLLKDVEQRRCDVVVVYRLDRLSRNVRDIYSFIDLAREKGIEFVSITESFDTTTAMGRAMLGVAAVFAQLTREMIAENVKDGVTRRAESGKWNGNKKNPPTGYLYSPETGSLLPDPDTADAVRQVFRWYVEEKLGTRSIARRLNVNGVPKSAHCDDAWRETVISKILANPNYCGLIKVGDGTVEGLHEPLISTELFGQAQAIIQSRKQLPVKLRADTRLLSGIPRCATCGTRLIVQTRRKTLASGKISERPAYRHQGNEHVGERHCPGAYVVADRLEQIVVDAIRDYSTSDLMQSLSVETVMADLAKDAPGAEEECSRLRTQLAELGDRFTEWAERLDDGLIDEEQFRSRNEALMQKKRDLQGKLAAAEAKAANREAVEVGLAQVKSLLTDFDRVWEEMGLEEQREMLRNLIEELRVGKGRGELKLLFLPALELKWPTRGEGGGQAVRSNTASRLAAPPRTQTEPQV